MAENFKRVKRLRYQDTGIVKKTTKWCYLEVQWKYEKNPWVTLRETNKSHGIQTTEYAEANEFIYELSFAWWSPFTLKMKDKIIAKVKSLMKKVTHKYGLELPRNVNHEYELDKRNNNTLWADAINK